jgi:uncharacterized OB-fold protein
LLLQACSSCDHVWHPPLPICPRCRSFEVEWRPASGRGTVHSFTIVHHAAHPAVEAWLPYLVALVRLAEGPLFVCNIRGCAPERVRIGMPVRVTFEEIAESVALPQFEPETG